MKTPVELLGDDCRKQRCTANVFVDDGPVRPHCLCIHDLERVAQRAREEMRELAAKEALLSACASCQHVPCAAMRLADGRIRALPVK